MNQETTQTACPYCGVGCGVIANTGPNHDLSIAGDPAHPSSQGRLCSKGAALADTVNLDHRLLYPVVDGLQTDWDTALARVASGLTGVMQQHGPQAVAFYASGQMLTEDYYVANKFMKGYVGSANIDTNSRLCMSSAVAAHKRAFGEDIVPGCYEDFELADLVILVGSNAAWCHPVLYQRLNTARQADAGKKLVVIDPRRTPTAEAADLHLPIRPGTDVALFNGLLAELSSRGFECDLPGSREALAQAADMSNLAELADTTGLSQADLQTFFDWYSQTERTVTAFSQGVNQSSAGTDKVNAIINCHLLTDRIGKPGACPFSLTGQTNAMGGREVGGLANMLAAHMDFDRANTVQQFWQSPTMARQPGLKALELIEAIEKGQIQALWIMATNPLVSLPDTARVQRALAQCPLVIVSDVTHTDTAQYAHVLLPATTWGEKSGTVTNSERVITRQRAFLSKPGQTRNDWSVICEVAQRMGFASGFNYQSPADIFREHAALSAFDNTGERLFNIGGLATLTEAQYNTLAPTRWPLTSTMASAAVGAMPNTTHTPRLFSDGTYPTPEHTAHLVPVCARPPHNATSSKRPLVLNTGRIRDHWHTMTRTAKSEQLSAHIPEPFVEIHPQDATRYGLNNQHLATIESDWGQAILRVVVTPRQQPGSVFAPIHWSNQFASQGRIDAVVNAAACPISGQPEFKHTPVSISAYQANWYGFVFVRRGLNLRAIHEIDHWTRVPGRHFTRFEVAGCSAIDTWSAQSARWLGLDDNQHEQLETVDTGTGLYRAAWLRDGRIEALVFVSHHPDALCERSWLASLFDTVRISDADRQALLAGRPADPSADTGPQVCSCFGVGRHTIVRAIQNQGLTDVDAVGGALKAGTNCGSCRSEIAELITQHQRTD